VTQTSNSTDHFDVHTGSNNTNFFDGIHFHGERLTSITLIKDEEIADQEKVSLSHEFYRGISARYEHILAAVDQPRLSKLKVISQKFREYRVVIVHGASGQGKTTLACRYLHDCVPEHHRFQIQVVEGRQHAVNMANALIAQATDNDSPITVYVDVSPNDVGWEELVKLLSQHRTIQTLVTIREEDFRRVSISGAELQFAVMELTFDRSEAEEVYNFLVGKERPAHILDFDDAWNRFGGEGPLMEFVYLVTQGDSLREKLSQQIRHIEDEIRAGKRSPAELQLLRLVSVAAAFEARLQVKELAKFLQLPAAQRTLKVMENEYYLLRTLENGTLVGGLHPVRSAILASLLTDPTFSPWVDSAVECLPFIVAQDIGNFLLYAFLRDHAELEPLLNALETYKPNQWNAISGVVRALLWLGIKQYVAANKQLIADVYTNYQHGWTLILDFDIAEAMPGVAENLLTTLIPFGNDEQQAQIEAVRNRQTNKQDIFIPTFNWLSHLEISPKKPQSEADWTGMAEVLFWVGRLQVDLPINEWLNQANLEDLVKTLPLTVLADLLLGLFQAHEEGYRVWINRHQTQLVNRFRQENQIVVWEDDGQTVRSHFPIKIYSPEQLSEGTKVQKVESSRSFLNLAMERLELCRKFFPDREVFGSMGYGHRNPIPPELPDDTVKNIPRANFLLPSLVSLNATFRGLAEQEFRPGNWESYVHDILCLRQSIVQSLKQLRDGLDTFFKSKKAIKILGQHINSDDWSHSRKLLTLSPSLPSCSFDAWGFVFDGLNQGNEVDRNNPYKRQNLALEIYDPYLKVLNSYIRTCTNFFDQAEWTLNFQPYFRNGENSQAQEFAQGLDIDLNHEAHLSVVNLTDAWKVLANLQKEFRELLSSFVDIDILNNLERKERLVFDQLWCSWYFFAFQPTQHFNNATWQAKQEFRSQVRAIETSLKKELRKISQNGVSASIISNNVLWKSEPSLWLQVDVEDPCDIYAAADDVIAAIRQAIVAIPQSELRRYAIDLTWSSILVVPLVQGKSLASETWQFSSILFSFNPDNDLGAWNFVPVTIPIETMNELGISTWIHPRLEIAQRFLGAISGLSLLASHLQDFGRLPEIDDQGLKILQSYIHQCSDPVSECFQILLDTEAEIFDYFSQIPSQELENCPNLITAIQGLLELNDQIQPIGDQQNGDKVELSISLTEFAEWANRLKTFEQLVLWVYLNWVSDVLMEVSMTTT
jgi:hypothetical protein